MDAGASAIPSGPSSEPSQASTTSTKLKSSNRMKPLKSKTARNLCAIDWCKQFPHGTTEEFKAYWDALDKTLATQVSNQNPAFGPSAIRGQTKIFVEYTLKLHDTWLDELSRTGADSIEVDVVSWFGRLTLDVIGTAEVPTFILAAHETTSIGITWTLFALTQHLEVQGKLRDELVNVKTDSPTMDELNALPYLDRVVRESLRVYSPVCNTVRIADVDDVIPLSRPIVDKRGVQRREIRYDVRSSSRRFV
ncbi:p450-domain-containing protein [Fistulina hepatica ATCC 64428]|nr:p450-domain-containing protein [Fistulina hepatica ATCC 64428]